MAYAGDITSLQYLATYLGLNMKNTGQVVLYTVPAGKTLYLLDVLLKPTSVSGLVTPAIVRVGKSPLFAEWAPLTTLTGLNAADQLLSLAGAASLVVRRAFAAGEVVALDVQTGANAATYLADVLVLGFLL